MKKGLVLEGGAMRGMFTAGVLDVFMEHGLVFDGAVGVSAGALFGCNYKSKQIGRSVRYNMNYGRDKRYMSLESLIKTGDLYGEAFCYHEIPERLDPFDTKTYCENPMDFYVVCTDVQTGLPVYHLCNKGDAEDIQWMRASASLPLVARIVSVGGKKLLDGGISDSIPYRWMMEKGYEKTVVVLTQDKNYRKKKSSMTPIFKMVLHKYPFLLKALENRYKVYNDALDELEELEALGKVFVIRPPKKVGIKRTENDPVKLWELYAEGRKTGLKYVEQVKSFISEKED